MADDYYKILGVSRDASAEDIQKAYRKLATKYHPDMNPDDAKAKERFQQVQQAYDVLNDADRRAKYDRFGSDFESGGGPQWQSFQGGGFEGFDFGQIFGSGGGGGGTGGFEDILHQFAGGGAAGGPRRRSAPRRTKGANVSHEIRIPFTTAIEGGKVALTVRRGDGRVETLSPKIARGTEDGKKLRLRGQGEPSPNGGPPGDLLLTVRVADHPSFRRRGKDLEVTVPVTLAEAALGAKIDVPTPKGEISLTIPPGTTGGKRLRLKGMGVAKDNESPGDLFAVVQIALPKQWDDAAKELIRQLDQDHPVTPRTDLKW